ncbi:MAG: hypothetical protein KKG21_04075 [Candidatus Omnitrophica bacterium]|nr:hypothetical protein [Candidatus Omnitrophota bacterium]
MNKHLIAVFLSIATVICLNLPLALSQEEGVVEVNSIYGEITSIDQQESVVIIRQLENKESDLYKDTAIYLDNLTAIEKDYETIGLNDLKIGDYADVEYKVAENGRKTATYVLIVAE